MKNFILTSMLVFVLLSIFVLIVWLEEKYTINISRHILAFIIGWNFTNIYKYLKN
jgi:hypothetical protein